MKIRKILFGLLFIAFFLSYLSPIIESDFFWHLRAGQTIWDAGNLSAGFSTQWLGQVLLYLVWKIAGFNGIVFLRAAIYTGILVFLFFWMQREDTPPFVSFLFLLFPAHIFLSFPSERPQIFSFLLFPVTIYILERFRKDESKLVFLLFPVMLLWANLHAGFFLGFISIFIYLLVDTTGFFLRKTSFKKAVMIASVVLSLSLVFVLKPGSLGMITGMLKSFGKGAYLKSLQEYLPPYVAFKEFNNYFPAYWLFIFTSLFTLFKSLRNMPAQQVLLIIFFMGLSLSALRFMPFFLMLAPLIASHNIPRKLNWGQDKILYAGLSSIILLWLIFVLPKDIMGINREFPQGSVKFLKQIKISGSIFNYSGWAGFLMWSLPEYNFFMPVENVRDEIDIAYDKIIWGSDAMIFGGRPEWKALLDAYGLNAVVFPGISPVSGERFPLLQLLVNDREWHVVYSDNVANVFVRDSGVNKEIIEKFAVSKKLVFRQIAAQTERYLSQPHD